MSTWKEQLARLGLLEPPPLEERIGELFDHPIGERLITFIRRKADGVWVAFCSREEWLEGIYE